jgi:hypothetical protein
LVAARGKVLLTDEGNDSIWMFGVQPGGVAGGGRERSEAFREFKKGYLSVLFDIASEAESFEQFETAARGFLGDVNAENMQLWETAVREVRAGKLNLSGIKTENVDRWTIGVSIQRIDQQADSSANEFDEIREAA